LARHLFVHGVRAATIGNDAAPQKSTSVREIKAADPVAFNESKQKEEL
jgi:hypothetical protein